ncbi:MAG: hypothetical protein JO053_16040 [Acidobacteria bacterium]|nr:hypothetical protein [Acidobacteriota bacterium]
MNVNEAQIQLGLWHWLYNRGQRWACPNACKVFDTGECDLLTVMRSGLACEYEIKISRKDFRQDRRKPKFELFERRLAGHTTREPLRSGWKARTLTVPNFFFYVVPNKLVSVDEVPGFAGLIYVHDEERQRFTVAKKAARIHRDIIPDLKLQMGQKLMFRFWDQQRRVLAAA